MMNNVKPALVVPTFTWTQKWLVSFEVGVTNVDFIEYLKSTLAVPTSSHFVPLADMAMLINLIVNYSVQLKFNNS